MMVNHLICDVFQTIENLYKVSFSYVLAFSIHKGHLLLKENKGHAT